MARFCDRVDSQIPSGERFAQTQTLVGGDARQRLLLPRRPVNVDVDLFVTAESEVQLVTRGRADLRGHGVLTQLRAIGGAHPYAAPEHGLSWSSSQLQLQPAGGGRGVVAQQQIRPFEMADEGIDVAIPVVVRRGHPTCQLVSEGGGG